MNFQCICLRSDNKQSEISQRKPVISKANKFILEFKNAHNNLPGNAESKRKKNIPQASRLFWQRKRKQGTEHYKKLKIG